MSETETVETGETNAPSRGKTSGFRSIGTAVEPALYAGVNALALAQDRSVASIVRAALKSYLAQHGMALDENSEPQS